MAKQRIDTSAAVKIMQGAQREMNPPAHVPLDIRDRPFWHSVVAEFAKSEWTEHQLELAAMLARMMADLNREQQVVRVEGCIITRENGTTVRNPRARAVRSLTNLIRSMRRSLGLHAPARGLGSA